MIRKPRAFWTVEKQNRKKKKEKKKEEKKTGSGRRRGTRGRPETGRGRGARGRNWAPFVCNPLWPARNPGGRKDTPAQGLFEPCQLQCQRWHWQHQAWPGLAGRRACMVFPFGNGPDWTDPAANQKYTDDRLCCSGRCASAASFREVRRIGPAPSGHASRRRQQGSIAAVLLVRDERRR